MSKKKNRKPKNRFMKMKKQLVLIVMAITIGIFLLVFGTVRSVLTVHYEEYERNIVSLIENHDGVLPSPGYYNVSGIIPNYTRQFHLSSGDLRTIHYCSIIYEADGEITYPKENISEVETYLIPRVSNVILKKSQNFGYYENYYYHKTYDGDRCIITLLDCAQYEQIKLMITEILGGVLVIMAVMVTLIFAKASKKIIRPFEENSKLQQQFITDASHELKTPLAIISANAEVLQMKDGESKWLANIILQSKRMSELIEDLLTLSKADEVDFQFIKESVDLSDTALNILPSYHESTVSRNIQLHTSIQPHVCLNASSEMIQKLITILMDNAIKYTSDNGEIKLTIAQSGNKINMDFYNTAEIPDDYNLNNLFNRFYRPDSSRNSSTGGHGIGLSIARKIVEIHGGNIVAQRKDSGIVFSATFKAR